MVNLKLAARTLIKTPFLTAVAVLSLALGIGANAAIFSLLDQMILQSVPVVAPDQLVNLAAPGPKRGSTSCNQAGGCDEIFSYPMFKDLQEAQTGFAGLAAHRLFGANLARTGSETVSGQGMLVSGSYFPLLGVQPWIGRLLAPADDETIGAHPVAVLGHQYWENRLGADPAVLNQTIVINGQSMTVVGVVPRDFFGTTLGGRPDVFVPITMRGQMSPGWEGFEDRQSYWAYVFGRLAPDVGIEQADAQINTVYRAIINEVEAPLQQGMSDATMEQFRAKEITLTEGRRGQSSIRAEAGAPLAFLFSITGIVLLIACANIANLLLAQGANRSQEMALRGSLGASRRQLLAQLLTESMMLAMLGGVASLVVARVTLGLIGSILPAEASTIIQLQLNGSVMFFAAALSLTTGFIFGMYPALHSTRPDLVTILKSNAGQPSGARAAARFRSSLVTAQLALSMALLVGAGLFIKSLINVSRVDLGLATDNIIVFGISPQLNGYEPARSQALFGRVEEALAAIPGVTSVTSGMVPVLAGSNSGTNVQVEGFETGPDIDANSSFNRVGPAYFSTLGIPLLAGREFTTADDAGSPRVAIINEAFARKFGLDPRQAVGKRMARGGGGDLNIEIVGIVQDAKYSEVKREIPPLFFTPYRQNADLGFLNFYVRTSLEADHALRSVPSAIAGLDSNLPVEDLKTLEQQVRDNVFLDRMISTLSTSFAVLATLLAAVGLYGVLAFTVTQRTREIGVRMALGADGGSVRAMVLRQVARMTVIGGAIGVAGALGLGRAAQSLLFGMESNDPWVVGAVVALLAAVAFVSAYVPARRASRVDPMQALRYE